MLGLLLEAGLAISAHAGESKPTPITILKIEGPTGAVEVMRAGAVVWDPARDNQVLYPGDRIRTLEKGRVTIRWFDNSMMRLPPLSDLRIEPGPDAQSSGFNLLKGFLYFFHRDGPTDARFRTRTASAAIRGTEFVLAFVEPEGRMTLIVLDGQVELNNAQGLINLVSGEQGVAEPNQAPRKTAVINTTNVIQWCLYYPGVLDVEELELTAAAKQALAGSLEAYRAGDLLGALAKYPMDRAPGSVEERVYRAAVWLAVGQVEQTEQLLNSLPADLNREGSTTRIAEALRRVIAAVKLQELSALTPGRGGTNTAKAGGGSEERSALTPALSPGRGRSDTRLSTLNPQFTNALATELLAESYHEQSRLHLPEALEAARRAVEKSPRFGLGWARVAELEFSFGNTAPALAALEKSLQLSPRNAQAAALKGYLLAAQNRTTQALGWFERAIELDGGLGNAWLGRGLCKIRQGKYTEGRDDVQTAVTVEPQRALLRSYLAKSYSAEGDDNRAAKELQLAKLKDSKDPTAWLYSALLDQQENRINDAVRDLEHSQELNDNRSVYRSRLLLDQDRAVRGANLASIYRDAGMFDVSVREAGRAVTVDPANYSAHLFLANSYYEMLDPHQYNQRYEAAQVDEYLTATLLAPVGAGLLSQPVSAQEYSRFFERDGLGLYSSTEYLSRGAWQQYAAQYGRFGDFSYSLDGYYRSDPGQRANNDLEQFYGAFQVKQQITPSDSVYLQTVWTKAKYGDLAQVYDPATNGNQLVRSQETQEPLFLAGYHHEWSPGNHSLLLAGWLQDTLNVNNPQDVTLLLSHLDPITFSYTNSITGVSPQGAQQVYRSEQNIYTVEAQQIFQRERYALIGGGRFQTGQFDTMNDQTIPPGAPPPAFFLNPPQHFESDFQRYSIYGYLHWQVVDSLMLIGGVSYDHLTYPEDFRSVPISDRETTTDLVSPKAGLIWTPLKDTVARAAYSQSLGGVSLDQSFQLEPSQVAGFNQVWRSLIPESVGGANAAAQFESWNASLEHKFPTRTYVGLAGEILNSDVDRTVGAFEFGDPVVLGVPFILQSGTREQLSFQERSVTVTLNQLMGEGWSFGLRYRLSQAELKSDFPDIPTSAILSGGFKRTHDDTATLNNLILYGGYTHRSGLFCQAEAWWWQQRNAGDSAALPGDDFWQFNGFVGYRFPRRQAEIRIGVLNITDQNYQLNPLNLISELPRDRTFVASFRFSF